MSIWFWIILVVGIIWILFNIFLNSGGQAKFKSDLPVTEQSKKKKKVIKLCFLSLCLISLVMSIALIISLL